MKYMYLGLFHLRGRPVWYGESLSKWWNEEGLRSLTNPGSDVVVCHLRPGLMHSYLS